MVERSSELQCSLGNGVKELETNELDTVVIQRRAIRMKKDIAEGEILNEDNIDFLRPCPTDAFSPFNYKQLLGKKIKIGRAKGDYIRKTDV